MLQLKNHSPFSPAITLFPDEDGVDALYVVVKATFAIENNQVVLAEEQMPPQMEDEFFGAPAESSIKYMSEMHLTKPTTDVVVIGHAWAPDGKPINQMDCSINVGSYSKTVRVFGDRYWKDDQKTAPEPFEKMPLIYENAFGGAITTTEQNENGETEEKTLLHEVNPVGIGYGEAGEKGFDGERLPNIEDPGQLVNQPGEMPPPAGFGFLAPTWKPRVDFVGTYDEAWQKSRAPYLPEDFDNRFFNAAAPELVCNEYLHGGEPVKLEGLSPNGSVDFQLPMCDLSCDIKIAGVTENPDLNLETILFEPDENRFSMTWRAKLNCDKKALKISEIHLHGSWNDVAEAAA
jgi:hypothetical protein